MRARYSFAAALACVVLSLVLGGAAGLVLVIAAMGLVLDGGTRLWARAGGTGGLTSTRQ